uniref:Uncharacterized protein n=1 Tax=Arundo donax TaxID=35708 RepID=A0A0A9C8R2_ARUDO
MLRADADLLRRSLPRPRRPRPPARPLPRPCRPRPPAVQ